MGSNQLQDVTGPLIQDEDFNQFKESLGVDFFPKDNSGLQIDNIYKIGTTVFRFLYGYFKTFTFKDGANTLILKDTSGNLVIERNTVNVATIDSAEVGKGININEIKNLTIPKNAFAYWLAKIIGGGFSYGQTGQTGGTQVYTGGTVTITSTGRPILIYFENGYMGSSSVVTGFGLRLYRNGTLLDNFASVGALNIVLQTIPNPGIGFTPSNCYKRIDQPSAGTHTYTMDIVFLGTNASVVTDFNGRLHAIEM